MKRPLISLLNLLVVFGLLTTASAKIQAVEFTEREIDSNRRITQLDVVDLDRDTDLDIVAMEQDISAADTLLWYENNGGQYFTPHEIMPISTDDCLQVADLNGDNEIDLLIASTSLYEFGWLENDGEENFTFHSVVDNIIGTDALYAVDLDGANGLDIIQGAVGGFYWWSNDGAGNFTAELIDADVDINSVFPADLDKDNDLDIAAMSDEEVLWWQNDGSETFTKKVLETGTDSLRRRILAVDLDEDNDLDLVTTIEDADEIAWWENNGSGTFSKHLIDGDYQTVDSVDTADVDNDGDMDILAATTWSWGITWWENDGAENFTKHFIDDNGGADDIQAVDLDGDTDIDLVTGDYARYLNWWEQLGTPNGVGKQAHYRIGGDTPLNDMAWHEPVDTPATGIPREENFRLRFQIYNDGSLDFEWQPQLEWSSNQGSGFSAVPTASGLAPFYLADTGQYADGATISSSYFYLGAGTGTKQDGKAYDTSNPAGSKLTLTSGRYTEIEFNLRANANAGYNSTYYFRLTDNGEALNSYTAVAQLSMDTQPGTIAGVVKNQDGKALEAVSVAINTAEKDQTDAAGAYSFTTSPGNHDLSFSKANYWEASGRVNVTSGATTQANQILVAKSGCLEEDTNCALKLLSLIPFVGTAADLVDIANVTSDLCQVGQDFKRGNYATCAAQIALFLADVANVPILSPLLDLAAGGEAADCVIERLDTLGQTLGKVALMIWNHVNYDPGEDVVFVFQVRESTLGTRAGSGIDFELSDDQGKALRTHADQITERSINGSYALASEEGYTIGMVSTNSADYTLSFTGTTTANYDLDLIIPQSNGSSVLVSFSDIPITPGTKGSLEIASDSSTYSLDLDTNGDGDPDQTIDPSAIEASASGIFLPLIVNNNRPGKDGWSYDVRVDNATTGHQLNPDFEIGSDGTLYAVWEDYRNGEYRDSGDIYFAYSTDKGKSWSTDMRVNDAPAAGAARRYPHLAVAPNGTVYVVWQDFRRDPNPTDPGSTREDDQNPDIYLSKLPKGAGAFQGDILVYDQGDYQDSPDVIVDSTGAVYVAFYDRTGDIFYGDVVVVKSTNGGASFGAPVVADNQYAWSLWPRLAVDRTTDTLHLIFQAHPRYYKPFYTHSTDNGATWSDDVQLDAGPDRDWYDAARHIFVTADQVGHVLVLWSDERDDPDNCYSGGSSCHDEFDIYGNYSLDSGGTWLTDHNVRVNDDSTYDWIINPTATYAPDGSVIAVWRDSRSGDDNSDIYLATSADYGATWSTNQRVDHAPYDQGADKPIVVTNAQGGAYVLWQDYRNGDWDIYMTFYGVP